MKLRTLILFFLISFITIQGFGQNLSKLDKIPLKEDADYKKAEKAVLQCAKYIITNPIKKDDQKRKSAENFISKWMAGTPHFTFSIDYALPQIVGNNGDILGVYLAYYSKYTIENTDGDDNDDILKHTLTSFLEYCKNPSNKVEMTDVLKQLIEQEKDSKFQSL